MFADATRCRSRAPHSQGAISLGTIFPDAPFSDIDLRETLSARAFDLCFLETWLCKTTKTSGDARARSTCFAYDDDGLQSAIEHQPATQATLRTYIPKTT